MLQLLLSWLMVGFYERTHFEEQALIFYPGRGMSGSERGSEQILGKLFWIQVISYPVKKNIPPPSI